MQDPVARARAIADTIRQALPDQAAAIDRLIAEVAAGTRPAEGLNIKVGIKYRLEKFDGDYAPDKAPVEVIEGTDNL